MTKKIPLSEARPDLAAQLADKALTDEVGVADRRRVTWLCDRGHTYEASVASRTQMGTNCPYCSNRRVLPGFNDLATTNPDIAEMLVNKDDATKVTAGSKKKLDWRCEQGHTWAAAVTKITHGQRCPYCSGKKVLEGFNDLATTRPDLAERLVDKNIAKTVTQFSNKKLTWECPECKERYEASPAQMSTGKRACPNCAQRRAHVGRTDLATTRPDLTKYLVDKGLATRLTEHSNKVVSWKCPTCGHIWDEAVYKRARTKTSCPECALLKNANPELASQLVDQSLVETLRTGSRKIVQWHCEKGHTWWATVYNRSKPNGTGCPTCAASATSEPEKELAEFVRSIVPESEVLTNDRKALDGKELDIFIPSRNVAIEFNGTFWHDERHLKDDAHETKRQLCEKRGIHLIQIWQDSWEKAKQGCKNLIMRELCNDMNTMDAEGLSYLDDQDAIREFAESLSTQPLRTNTTYAALYDEHGNIVCAIEFETDKDETTIVGYTEKEPVRGGIQKIIGELEARGTKGTWLAVISTDGETSAFETPDFIAVEQLPPRWSFIDGSQSHARRRDQDEMRKLIPTHGHETTDEKIRELAKKNNLFRTYNSGYTLFRYQRQTAIDDI